jgi:hypothetical protein
VSQVGKNFQDDMVALGFGGTDGSSIYNPSDSNTVLNTGACEVMRNHMQVCTETLAISFVMIIFIIRDSPRIRNSSFTFFVQCDKID